MTEEILAFGLNFSWFKGI